MKIVNFLVFLVKQHALCQQIVCPMKSIQRNNPANALTLFEESTFKNIKWKIKVKYLSGIHIRTNRKSHYETSYDIYLATIQR